MTAGYFANLRSCSLESKTLAMLVCRLQEMHKQVCINGTEHVPDRTKCVPSGTERAPTAPSVTPMGPTVPLMGPSMSPIGPCVSPMGLSMSPAGPSVLSGTVHAWVPPFPSPA